MSKREPGPFSLTDRLPRADMQYPSCGSCGGETYHDADSFRCDDCRLAFDSNNLEAEYADEEDATCGAACANFWHDDNMIRSGWGYDCGTCILPAGHTSDHFTGCNAKEITP